MFQIFLVDKINNKYVELDCDGIDFTTVFGIGDINNIVARNDTITKNLKFKSTATNNKAFGNAGFLNKDIHVEDNNLLDFNYNPQKLVDCVVYEDSQLITKGKLRLIEVEHLGNGAVNYECVITSEVKLFNAIISDKLLTDIDLTSMSHTYSRPAILNSWTNYKTLGYIYPLINYGHPFETNAGTNTDFPNAFNILNFKPAILLKTILNNIFTDAGYTYEIKADTLFKEYFESLLIPYNGVELQNIKKYNPASKTLEIRKAVTETQANAGYYTVPNIVGNDLRMGDKTDVLGLISQNSKVFGNSNPFPEKNKHPVIYDVTKTFKSTAKFTATINYVNSISNFRTVDGRFIVYERAGIANTTPEYNSWAGWTVLAEENFRIPNGTSGSYTTNITIPEREYTEGKQLRMYFQLESQEGINLTFNITYSIPSAALNFDGDIVYNASPNDTVTPSLPDNIKQTDFLQSIRNLFNFYVYSDEENDKKIIFERYDDYYGLTSANLLPSTALDWTKKIDYSAPFKMKSNITIPKNYEFKFKADSDYVNDFYFKKYNKTYGDYTLSDVTGIADKKSVEVIFSPTPLIDVAPASGQKMNFNIEIPWIYKVSSNKLTPTQSNMRILSMSGTKIAPITLISEILSNGVWLLGEAFWWNEVPVTQNYFYKNDVPIFDLHFGRPEVTFFNYTSAHDAVNYSFSNYKNQITELKNPNVSYIECEVLLNEIDINNLDLKIPVFIDTGANGHAYFKVLNIEYKSSNDTASVSLQKINV